MAPRATNNGFTKFFNSITWKIVAFLIPSTISIATFILVYLKLPDEIATFVKNTNETHDNVSAIACTLKDKIAGGQDINVGVSKRAIDGQAILLTNSDLPYIQGQSIILYNPGSNYKPRVKLLISVVEEPSTPAEEDGKIQMYINKKTVSMMDYNFHEGSKKLKIMAYENGENEKR
ncbi:hypothetical protein [Sulfuricurvum sp.]|uniref:hypothetical protein n=1 Tax=Sulfuricurvum sp. TaxID=2025608 RepID=UPI00356A114B